MFVLAFIHLMKRYLVIITFFVSGLILTAQRYANEFLYIGTDAVGMSLGGNNTAMVQGGQSVSWNPAGLVSTSRPELSLMHAAYFGSLAMVDYIGYARPVNDQAVFSASLLRFGVDNIMNTTQLIDENGNVDYSRIRYFSAADYALFLSYARRNWIKGLNIGINAKVVYRHIGDFAQGVGLGFDAGAQYAYKDWLFGLIVRDVTTTYTHWQFNQERLDDIARALDGYNQSPPEKSEFSIPSVQWGVARKWDFQNKYTLAAELDFKNYFYQRHALLQTKLWSVEPGLSLQGSYKEKVFLRLGLSELYKTDYFGVPVWYMQPSAGIGLKLKHLSVDYAFTTFTGSSLYSHIFSINLDLRIFKKKP